MVAEDQKALAKGCDTDRLTATRRHIPEKRERKCSKERGGEAGGEKGREKTKKVVGGKRNNGGPNVATSVEGASPKRTSNHDIIYVVRTSKSSVAPSAKLPTFALRLYVYGKVLVSWPIRASPCKPYYLQRLHGFKKSSNFRSPRSYGLLISRTPPRSLCPTRNQE